MTHTPIGRHTLTPLGQARGAAAGNGLLNNLIAYWAGNEASGNRLDLHTNALHLTDINTVTSNPGIVYPLARQYTAVNTEYHTRPGDDALLSAGNVDLTIASWVYFDSKAANMCIAGKYDTSTTREYVLFYRQITDTFRLTVSWNGTNIDGVESSTFGSPAISTWYLIVTSHDAVNDVLTIQVNNGTVDSTPYALGVFDGTAQFAIGVWSVSVPQSPLNGRIGPTMFWKSVAGGGGVLDATKRGYLWNGGAGLTYAQFTT